MNSILIALSYAFCWGVGTTLTKLALSEISATTLLVIQLISSVLFLAIACYIKTRQLPFSLAALKQLESRLTAELVRSIDLTEQQRKKCRQADIKQKKLQFFWAS